jgi:hypothetical protein
VKRHHRCLLALLTLPLIAWTRLDAQSPSLDEVLQRTSTYLRQWIPQLANIVATETYDERQAQSGVPGPQKRRLKSDVLLVQYPVGPGWMLFRDIGEVDGKPLAHPPDRLLKLFIEPNLNAREQADQITLEGLASHLAGANASSTNPFLGIALMQDAYRPRLRFRLGNTEPAMGPHVRVIQFDEREESEAPAGGKPEKLSLLLPDSGRANGSIWLDEETGVILKTDVRMSLGLSLSSATIFARDARLGMFVPQEMRTSWRYVRGVATYSDYRRFDVQTVTRGLGGPQK